MNQKPNRIEMIADFLIDLQHIFAAKPCRNRIIIAAIVPDRRIDRQPIGHARLIVFHTMPRGNMHNAGTVFGGHKLRIQSKPAVLIRRVFLHVRMDISQSLKLFAKDTL